MTSTAPDSPPLLTRLRWQRLPVVALGAASLLGGCYSYLPTPSDNIASGTEVRVVLTDAGSLALAPVAGPQVASVDGYVDRAGGDSLVMLVRRVTKMRGDEDVWTGERLAIPASAISSVQRKRLSQSRTALAAVVGAGVFTAAVLAAGNGGGGEPPVVVGPPPSGQ